MADEENVPTYTETDETGLDTWLDALPERAELLQLPVTHWPEPSWHPAADHQYSEITLRVAEGHNEIDKDELWLLQSRIITTLFDAVKSKNTEIVTLLITKGWVSPDVTNLYGETPLITAVNVGNGAMVCTLVGLGAKPNGYGQFESAERTPVMVAAALGRLALVKVLVEDLGGDDGIIAPDGQLALRLAADRGHRDVVAFLPSRRGGAWRRWQVHHAVAVRRVKRAGHNIYRFFKFFLWEVPRFFLWSCPKHIIVLPAWKSAKYCWTNKRRFAHWCKDQTLAMPGRAKNAGKAVWKAAKKVPEALWKVAKEIPRAVARVAKETWRLAKKIPGAVKRLVLAFWRLIKRIPGALKVVALWIWTGLKRVGAAVGDVFLKVVSALHTALMAVLNFFRRITLKDVWNGVRDVFHAIFVGLPKAIWEAVKTVGDVAFKVIIGLFGCTGMLFVWLFQGLWWVAQYVPQQLWAIICGIGSSMAKGYHEILVWFNPKH